MRFESHGLATSYFVANKMKKMSHKLIYRYFVSHKKQKSV